MDRVFGAICGFSFKICFTSAAFNKFWPEYKPRKTLRHTRCSQDYSHEIKTENKSEVRFWGFRGFQCVFLTDLMLTGVLLTTNFLMKEMEINYGLYNICYITVKTVVGLGLGLGVVGFFSLVLEKVPQINQKNPYFDISWLML